MSEGKRTNERFRHMSGAERMRLRFPNANVVMAARIHGALSRRCLKSAAARVQQRHPLLRARVHLDEDQVGWFTPRNVSSIPVQIVSRTSERGWMETAIDQHAAPFPWRTGPLVRLTLLHAGAVSDLLVTAHHAICDGLSLVYLIRDLLHHLADAGQEVDRLPVPPLVDDSTSPVPISGNLVTRLGTRVLNHSWEKKGITFDAQDDDRLNRAFWQQHTGHMLAWALTRECTSALIARCREERVTVNTALVTAFVVAQNRVEEATQHLGNVIVSVDFRDRLTVPVDQAFAFYASAVRPRLEPESARQPFWDTARVYHAKINSLLTDENIFASQRLSNMSPSLLDALSFARAGLLDDKLVNRLVSRMKIDRINASLVVTNLGRLDIPVDYGSLHLTAMHGPYVFSDTVEKYLGVLTLGGEMHLTLCWGEAIIDSAQVESIRDTAMDILGQAVGWQGQASPGQHHARQPGPR